MPCASRTRRRLEESVGIRTEPPGVAPPDAPTSRGHLFVGANRLATVTPWLLVRDQVLAPARWHDGIELPASNPSANGGGRRVVALGVLSDGQVGRLLLGTLVLG